MRKSWSKESIITAIQSYYKVNNKIPVALDFRNTKGLYPGATTVVEHFGTWNNALVASGFTKTSKNEANKNSIITAIQKFTKENNRTPTYRDFHSTNGKYPSTMKVVNIFGTWNAAIEASGFPANLQTTFGCDTYGLDKHLYRSRAEAYFADNFLFNKYKYVIEPRYPEPYKKYYDWYIPSLDLYIELDGGLRPKVIKEKIEINKILNRRCLFISISKIYKHDVVDTLIKTLANA